jgi:hypothetical protein
MKTLGLYFEFPCSLYDEQVLIMNFHEGNQLLVMYMDNKIVCVCAVQKQKDSVCVCVFDLSGKKID